VFEHGLVGVLCDLIEASTQQQLAAECLVELVERKDSKEDRLPLLHAFTSLQSLLNAGSFNTSIDKQRPRVLALIVVIHASR
jgi:hypothetical protein